MKKIVVVVILFIVSVSVGLVYFTYTKPAPVAASLLPDSTLLFIETPNFPLMRAQFTSTEAYALLQEPEMQDFLAVPFAAVANTLGLGRSDRGPSVSTVSTVLSALQGEVFIAVTRFSTGSQIQPRLVFGADVKRKRLEAEAVLGQLKRRLIGANSTASVSERKFLGVRYTQWQLPDGHRLCHAFLNSLLVFSVDEDDIRDIITRYAGHEPADSAPLATSPRFQNALQNMPGRHALFAYLNVEQIMGLVGPLLVLAPQGAGVLQNVARIQSIASSVTLTEDLVQDVGHVAYGRGEKPSDPPLQRKTFALTSPETSFYSVHSVDLSAAYTQTMNALAHSGNATLSSSAAQFDQAIRGKDIRIRETLLQKLGPEIAVIGNWRTGTRYPDIALVAEFDSTPESRLALGTTLTALTETTFGHDAQVSWEDNTYRGETLHTVRLAGKPVEPTYVAAGNFFILALSPDYARELLDHLGEGTKKLSANASFRDIIKRLPKNPTALTYCDLSTVYHHLYALARANTSDDATNQLFALAKLPRAETIARHTATYASVTVNTDRGQTTVAFSSLGKPLTLLVGIAGGLGAAQPLLAQLPLNFIPGLPTMSSDTGAPPPPRENPTATSQTPTTQ